MKLSQPSRIMRLSGNFSSHHESATFFPPENRRPKNIPKNTLKGKTIHIDTKLLKVPVLQPRIFTGDNYNLLYEKERDCFTLRSRFAMTILL